MRPKEDYSTRLELPFSRSFARCRSYHPAPGSPKPILLCLRIAPDDDLKALFSEATGRLPARKRVCRAESYADTISSAFLVFNLSAFSSNTARTPSWLIGSAMT